MAITGTDINRAAQLLKAGKNVAIPTETVYGLAGNAYNEDAVLNIFRIKKRPKFDPLIVHVANIEQIDSFVSHIPHVSKKLLETFSPGPLTVVLPKKDNISDLVTSGLPNVAVRIPNHPIALALLNLLDFPLAAPSANPFTYVSPTSAAHVLAQLGDQIEYILDGGNCQVGLESTIVREFDDHVLVLRLGGLAINDLQAVSDKPLKLADPNEETASPGSFKKHYSTKTPLFIGIPKQIDVAANYGYLSFHEAIPTIPLANQKALAKDGSTLLAAKNLFASLREMDAKGFDKIFVELAPNTGLGPAINDRLQRASWKE